MILESMARVRPGALVQALRAAAGYDYRFAPADKLSRQRYPGNCRMMPFSNVLPARAPISGKAGVLLNYRWFILPAGSRHIFGGEPCLEGLDVPGHLPDVLKACDMKQGFPFVHQRYFRAADNNPAGRCRNLAFATTERVVN